MLVTVNVGDALSWRIIRWRQILIRSHERKSVNMTEKRRHGERGPGVKTLLTKAALDTAAAGPALVRSIERSDQ